MRTMDTHTFTQSELEEYLDQIKTIVVRGLVKDEFLSYQEADEWCAENTIKLSQKGFFRTLSDNWKKASTAGYALVVNIKKGKDE